MEASSGKKRSTPMEWTLQHDTLMCREILVIQPYTHKKGSNERGRLWTQISENLNIIVEIKFRVTQRGVRERFDLLKGRFLAKMRQEEVKGTGTSPPEPSELDTLIEEIIEREKLEVEAGSSKTKNVEQDRKIAEEMRKKAMEKVGETKKRNDTDGRERKRKRTTGNEAVEFFKEKFENERQLKERELSLQQQQNEMFINMMQQSQTMQNTLLQQQQQNLAFMAVLEKRVPK